MLKYSVWLFYLCTALSACDSRHSQKKQFDETSFKYHRKLPGDSLILTHMNLPVDICIVPEKNLLLVSDLKDTNFVKAYDMNTCQFIRSFVKKGPGPNEQLDCHKLQLDGKRQKLYVTDLSKRKIYVYAIADILNPTAEVLPIEDVSFQTKYMYRPVLLNGKGWIDYYENKIGQQPALFALFDRNGDFRSKAGMFPPPAGNYNPMELQTSYVGGFAKSADGKKIVLCYYNTDYIDLYDTLGRLKKRIHGPDGFESEVKTINRYNGTLVISDKASRFAYSASPCMGDSAIYVLYKGRSISERGYHTNRLFCFNSQLQPQVSYQLAKPVFSFDVDWDKKILYALHKESANSYLMKFPLP